MRRAAKVDLTQSEIVKTLRDCGASVQLLHAVGHGCPDAAVGFRGHNVFLEIKTGERPCDRKLTKDEADWHSKWAGQVAVVSTPDEALNAVILAAGVV